MSDLLETLADHSGLSVNELLESVVRGDLSWGLCVECLEYSTEVEPECREGYCENCGCRSVQSAGVIAGII